MRVPVLVLLLIGLNAASTCGSVDADQDGWTVEEGDCDDADATVYPGAFDQCDGKDNDCDAEVDEDQPPVLTFTDGDQDGFGVGAALPACEAAPGRALRPGDCNDQDTAVNPDAPEICGNGKDDNCDFQVDEAVCQ